MFYTSSFKPVMIISLIPSFKFTLFYFALISNINDKLVANFQSNSGYLPKIEGNLR